MRPSGEEALPLPRRILRVQQPTVRSSERGATWKAHTSSLAKSHTIWKSTLETKRNTALYRHLTNMFQNGLRPSGLNTQNTGTGEVSQDIELKLSDGSKSAARLAREKGWPDN